MDTLHRCPACGQPDTLILLGSRDDHPHGWRWWSTTITLLYLCERCDALLEIGATPESRLTPRRMRRALRPVTWGRVRAPSVLHPPSVRGRRGHDPPQWGV